MRRIVVEKRKWGIWRNAQQPRQREIVCIPALSRWQLVYSASAIRSELSVHHPGLHPPLLPPLHSPRSCSSPQRWGLGAPPEQTGISLTGNRPPLRSITPLRRFRLLNQDLIDQLPCAGGWIPASSWRLAPEDVPSEFAVWDLVRSHICAAAPTLVWNRSSPCENMRNIIQSSRLFSEVYLMEPFVRLRLFPLALDFPPCALQLIRFASCLSFKLTQDPDCKTRHADWSHGGTLWSFTVLTYYITAHMWDVTSASRVKLPRSEEACC